MNANMKTILNTSEHMKTRIILALLGLLALSELCFGLVEERIGPDASEVAPKGLVEIVRHPSRVYLYDWSGALFYYFQATPAEINGILTNFAKARLRDHVIRIKPAGTNTVKSSNGTTSSIRIDAEQQEMGTNTVKSFNGTTITYKQLARRIGTSRGFQAIGRANASNPVPIIIPCHRVVGTDGSLVGYSAGIKTKEFLLKLEGALMI